MGVKKMRSLSVFLFLLVWYGTNAVEGQVLRVTNIKPHLESLEVEVVLENSTNKDYLVVMPNSRDVDKTNYYITTDETNGVVEIRRHFYYFPPEVITNIEYPCFTLSPLKSKDVYRESIIVKYPISPTYLFFNMITDLGRFRSLSLQLGILPFDSSLEEIQNKKPFGRCVDGQEIIPSGVYGGQTLFEIQRIVRTEKLISIE
jgi:hypothetical protein